VSYWRHYTLIVLFGTGIVGLLGRMAYLTVTESAFLKQQGDVRSLRVETLVAHRGVIFDRNGEPLAVSTPVMSVWFDPSRTRLTSVEMIRVGRALGIDADDLARRQSRSGEREFLYIKRRVSPEESDRVAALAIDGVRFEREYRRYYPAGETTAHVVGVTNIDDDGQEGAELAFDSELDGKDGKKRVLKDRRGNPIKDVEYLSAPRFGADVTLSIDLRLQFFAHRELKAAIEHNGARSGSLVLLDARTGEILALANQPSFNPNNIAGLRADAMRNRAITDMYEPGSTVKPITVLAALESGRVSARSIIDTSPGYLHIGRKLIQDPVNRGAISLAEVLAKSSQVGIARIALMVGKTDVYDAFGRVGFGTLAASGLPGEVSGQLPNGELDKDIVRAALAYGYGLTVTPMQLAASYLILATGGVRLPVSIVRRETIPAGERVFDERYVREVVAMLEGVTTLDGTAPKARVHGYRIAGKTGTARKVGAGGYDDARHVAFFAGLAPAQDPRVVMVVVVNEPTAGASGGGEVAAPIFSRVMARALRVLSIEPEATT
jgi:cell division protein FtsI (penicillin-binding protein 3)